MVKTLFHELPLTNSTYSRYSRYSRIPLTNPTNELNLLTNSRDFVYSRYFINLLNPLNLLYIYIYEVDGGMEGPPRGPAL